MALIDVMTSTVYHAKTGPFGTYALSIPYAGKPVVLQERMLGQVYADKAIAAVDAIVLIAMVALLIPAVIVAI